MTDAIQASYEYCRGVARSRARNFYYSFRLLPKAERDAMCAMYAFMRYCDDLSDDPAEGDARSAIERWSADLDRALAGDAPEHPVWPAFCASVERYRIPHEYFRQMIAGVSSDLEPRTIRTFDDLRQYCYQVASVVGLCVIYILGFESPEAPRMAEDCGVAFQLTNILRDVGEDAGLGRVYLPQEDMARFGVSPEALRDSRPTPEFLGLMRFEAARAREYYARSAPLVNLVKPAGRPMLRAIVAIYSRLLERIERSGFDVLRRRVSLPAWEKVWLMLRSAAAR
ncbi:MAG: phytoene/squalene synthase family protein [Acidobacteriales bacterium]|nr:phytoene/squalene synthase family protein [Terriglobales bacterium]